MEEVLNEDNRRFGSDLKIITIGDVSTGKTSILRRYLNNTFDEKSQATIMPDFSYKVVKVNGANFRIQFWDLPGTDRNPIMTSVFCKDANGVIFCCDIKDINSRQNIVNWKNSLNNMLDEQEIPKILLENKCDLVGEDKYNEGFEELKKFANDNNINECYRTSALNGYNVNKAITFLINEIAKTFSEEDLKSMSDLNTSRIKLKNQNNQKKCC